MGVKWQVQPSMLSLVEEPGMGSKLYLQNIRKAQVLYKSISKHTEDQRITKETRGEPADHKEDTWRSMVGWIDDEMNNAFSKNFEEKHLTA